MSDDRHGRGTAGFLLGLIVGAIGGLLLAPRSGQETREQLRTRADEVLGQGKEAYSTQRDRFQKMATEKTDQLKGRIEDAREKLRAQVESATEFARGSFDNVKERAEGVKDQVESVAAKRVTKKAEQAKDAAEEKLETDTKGE